MTIRMGERKRCYSIAKNERDAEIWLIMRRGRERCEIMANKREINATISPIREKREMQQ